MTDRRYDDDEVAAIFRAAAEGAESVTPPGGQADGLTLSDLQGIAREVGLSPDAVARAAHSLDSPRERSAPQTLLGLPISVERTIALSRPLTDAEWELLVVELRQVFGARGRTRAEGSLREWSNGNLCALLEPTPTGYQLRLSTFKGNARPSVAAGGFAVGMSVVVGALLAANGPLSYAGSTMALLATLGAAFIANGTLRLPAWARLRGRQMDEVIERLRAATQDMRD